MHNHTCCSGSGLVAEILGIKGPNKGLSITLSWSVEGVRGKKKPQEYLSYKHLMRVVHTLQNPPSNWKDQGVGLPIPRWWLRIWPRWQPEGRASVKGQGLKFDKRSTPYTAHDINKRVCVHWLWTHVGNQLGGRELYSLYEVRGRWMEIKKVKWCFWCWRIRASLGISSSFIFLSNLVAMKYNPPFSFSFPTHNKACRSPLNVISSDCKPYGTYFVNANERLGWTLK